MARSSLKHSLNLALLGLALLPLLVAGSLSAAIAFLNERDTQTQTYTRRAASTGRAVSNYLEVLNGNLASLNRYRGVMSVPPAERADMFAILMAQQPAIFEVVLFDAQRRPLTHVSARTPVLGTEALAWLRKSDLEAAASSNSALMGAIEFDPLTGDPEFALVQPITGLRSGKLEGYLVARCRMAEVWQIVERLARGTPDESMIVDADGRVIAHPNPSVVLTGSRFSPPASTSLGYGPDGVWSLIGVSDLRVLGRDLRMVNVVHFSTVFAGSFRLAFTFAAISVVTLVGAALLVLYLRRLILRPVDRLTDAARRIQGGDWTTKVEVPREDELGQLAVTFNEMTSQLRATNQVLELRVAERTADLTRSLEELHRTQTHLVQSEKMAALGGLVAGIAHEINTPLGIGVTAASHLEMKVKELAKRYQAGTLSREDVESFVATATQSSEMVLSNLQRAADLVRSFKLVAVDQSGGHRRHFFLKNYLEEVLHSLSPQLSHTGYRISLECPEELRLYSHPGSFSQVITNLVMNSLLHGFDDIESGHIVIRVEELPEGLLLRYTDDGKGIAIEHLPHIFEPFYTTKRGQGGSGLGLHVVYNIVTQSLGGSITCTSTPGQGVAFDIRIPHSALIPADAETAGEMKRNTLRPSTRREGQSSESQSRERHSNE